MAELYRYAAFISYSSKDAAFAKRLHRALESYGIPSSLGKFDLIGGGKPNRIYPVFRDREELAAGHLGDVIEANLRASAALIVVCSPNAAASPWVQKEIEYFAGLGRRDKIFAIVADDAPLVDDQGRDATAASFPPAFRGDALSGDKLEPLAADARKSKDGFRNAWLKIVAGLIGVSPGQIIDRDKRRRRQQALTRVAASILALSAIGYASANVYTVLKARDALQRAKNEPSHLQRALLAVDALPPPGSIFPIGWPVAEARQTMVEGGFDNLLQILLSQHGVPTALAVSGDAPVVGFSDGAVAKYEAGGLHDIVRLSSRVVAIAADATRIAVADGAGNVTLIAAQGSQTVTPQAEPRDVAVASNGHVFIGLADGRVLEWDGVSPPRELLRHIQPVTALDAVEGYVVSAATDGSINLWSIAKAKSHVLVPPNTQPDFRVGPSALALSPDMHWLAVGRRDGSFSVMRLSDLSWQQIDRRDQMVLSIGFSPLSNQVLVGYEDGLLNAWTLNVLAPRLVAQHDGGVPGVRFFGGMRSTSVSFDETIRFWDEGESMSPATLRKRVCMIYRTNMGGADFDRVLVSRTAQSLRPDIARACGRRGLLGGGS